STPAAKARRTTQELPQGPNKLVQPLSGKIRFRAAFSRWLTDRLPRLALDLRSTGPTNPRHRPLLASPRAFLPLGQPKVDLLPAPARLPLLHDPPHDLLLLLVADLRPASLWTA